MQTVGIICEYNPLHRGHVKQLRQIRSLFDGDCAIVCLMSGNYVQRGQPAILDKSLRAEAALELGADLVLELPVTAALSSAEGFAAGGVRILSGFCDHLCFGAETADGDALMATAQALLSDAFPDNLRTQLARGCSFPAARQAALEALGMDGSLLSTPNNILAVEYCKGILSQGSAMRPLPILREGSYHAPLPDGENPSATALRARMLEGGDWQTYTPAARIFAQGTLHSLAAGERAILAQLRTMTDGEFEALPYGSEGLWRKLMHASRRCATLEQILTAAKSKRYTRSRLDRMVMCGFLGLTEGDLAAPAPYSRVLGLSDKGRELLKRARLHGYFPNLGEKLDHPYQAIEDRCAALYGLFALEVPEGSPPERLCYRK